LAPENVDLAYGAVNDALDHGRQAYIVCTLVDETDTEGESDDAPEELATDAKRHAAIQTAERLSKVEFKNRRVGLLHGRMTPAEKDRIMQEFSDGKIDILVSTTVIEVGVDVPNATVMVVWDADRFGLATLHQLRGRVGRGDIAGDVFLVSAAKKGSAAKKRLQALEKTTDGLELAELDLRLRHEGDVLGYKQSGAPTLKLVDLVEDADLVEAAHEDAVTLLTADPVLEQATHAPLAHEVRDRYRFYFDEGAGA
jgi:ATP-dependent DNA helicase RecG